MESFHKTISEIFFNLNTACYVFAVIEEQKDPGPNTLKWRNKWNSMQWVLLLKEIHTPVRNRLKQITLEILIQLRLALPISKKEKDEVIKKVIQKYHEQFPTQISHKIRRQQKERRKTLDTSVSKEIDEAQSEINTAFTVPFD